ncbi:MAG: universal stress protein [Halobacteriales archaeon]|nr:universal stress protein [Halobacteriales archaeon]
MGTLFVAYGEPGERSAVLEFALERAAAAGDDLLVHHVIESETAEPDAIREEIAATVERVAPDVAYEVRLDDRGVYSDESNVSARKRLIDAILEDGVEYSYVVMGNVEHGAIEELSLSSMTEAVIDAHAIPVLLVPV